MTKRIDRLLRKPRPKIPDLNFISRKRVREIESIIRARWGRLPNTDYAERWVLLVMLWTAPPPARRCHGRRGRPDSEDWTMQAVTTIGLDIAKSIFQVHAVDAEGNV